MTDPSAPASADGARGPARGPIVIGGLPRSGTSLMRAILGSHPDVAFFPREIPFFRPGGLRERYEGMNLGQEEQRRRFFKALARSPKFKESGEPIDVDALVAASATLAHERIRPTDLLRLVLDAHARRRGRPRWGVKDPDNDRHGRDILSAWPDAVFVHLVRDPRDTLLSSRARGFAPSTLAFASRWRTSARRALRLPPKDPTRYLAVRYEDLVSDPEATVRRLAGPLGLGLGDGEVADMLAMRGQPAWDGNNSSFGDLGEVQTISTQSIGRGRKELPPGDRWFLEWRLGSEMASWRYTLDGPTPDGTSLLRLGREALTSAWSRWRGRKPPR